MVAITVKIHSNNSWIDTKFWINPIILLCITNGFFRLDEPFGTAICYWRSEGFAEMLSF